MTTSSEKEFAVPPSGGRGALIESLPPEGGTANFGLAIEPGDPRRARPTPDASTEKPGRVRAIDENTRGPDPVQIDPVRSEMRHRRPRDNAPARVTWRRRLSSCVHSRSKSSSATLRRAQFRRFYEAQGRERVLPPPTFRPPYAPPRARLERPIPDRPLTDEAEPRRPINARSAMLRNRQGPAWKEDAALRGHVRWRRLRPPPRSPSIARPATNGVANKIDVSVRRCVGWAVRARAGDCRPELRPPQGIQSADRFPAGVRARAPASRATRPCFRPALAAARRGSCSTAVRGALRRRD